MFIDLVTNGDAIPVLERSIQFAARRQEVIAHNVANLSTPNFQPLDVSVPDFQASLSRAVDERRSRFGGVTGDLNFKETDEVKLSGPGLRLEPQEASGNILFHDRNNRDLERTMQAMVENLTAFRVASDLLRTRMEQVRAAISGRV